VGKIINGKVQSVYLPTQSKVQNQKRKAALTVPDKILRGQNKYSASGPLKRDRWVGMKQYTVVADNIIGNNQSSALLKALPESREF